VSEPRAAHTRSKSVRSVTALQAPAQVVEAELNGAEAAAEPSDPQ